MQLWTYIKKNGDSVSRGLRDRSFFKDERRYKFSSEFSVEDSRGEFVAEE
jgi:hypothetical protein